jgi:hypothetical protein
MLYYIIALIKIINPLNMCYLKHFFIAIFALFVFSNLFSQFTGISAGLAFSDGVDFNTGATGNPGLYIKGFYKVNKRLFFVPSITGFNKYSRPTFSEELKTYMFHGDFDGSYGLFKDKYVTFLAFTGINATAIVSKWDIFETTSSTKYFKNISDIKAGLNLGGTVHLFVNSSFDAFLSAKYIVGTFDQFVINAGVAYYWDGNRKKGKW